MFVDASHSRSIAGLKRQNTFSMGQVGAALVKGDNAIDTPPKRVAKDLLSALTGGRKEAGSPVPRTAKGSSSIQQLRDVSEIAPSAKLMRYSVVGEMKLYQKIWMTLDDPCYVNLEAPGCMKNLASHYAYFSIFLILLSSTTFTLQDEIGCVLKHDVSVDPVTYDYGHDFVTAENCKDWETVWSSVEVFAVVCFSLELLLRFLTSPDRWLFLQGSFNWIDFMAVLPFYLETVVVAVRTAEAAAALADGTGGNSTALADGSDEDDPVLTALRVLRVLRLARVFKLLKMGNASASLQLVSATAGAALADSFKILVALLMVTVICMIVFAAALSQFEPGTDYTRGPEYCEDACSEPAAWFLSITRTCWWSLVTLTGVGYGDEYPMWAVGRVIAMICATVGILIVAVPIEVIGRYFGQHFQRHNYSRAMEDECEIDGLLDIPVFFKKLQLLGKQGLLKVKTPANIGEVQAMVARYDGKGDCKLEHDEWAAMIQDVVSIRGDWEGCAMRKTVENVYQIKDELEALREEIKQVHIRRQEQIQELCAIARQKYPNGIPKGGILSKGKRPARLSPVPMHAPVAGRPVAIKGQTGEEALVAG